MIFPLMKSDPDYMASWKFNQLLVVRRPRVSEAIMPINNNIIIISLRNQTYGLQICLHGFPANLQPEGLHRLHILRPRPKLWLRRPAMMEPEPVVKDLIQIRMIQETTGYINEAVKRQIMDWTIIGAIIMDVIIRIIRGHHL
jgi:hypothetical protein